MNSKMKSWMVSWLSLKTKVEPGLRGSRVMSGDWRRLHQVRGVSGGSPENHWVPWLIHKAKTEEPKTVLHYSIRAFKGFIKQQITKNLKKGFLSITTSILNHCSLMQCLET
jgi:hypothetical protein